MIEGGNMVRHLVLLSGVQARWLFVSTLHKKVAAGKGGLLPF
jgi:hypothetical protein